MKHWYDFADRQGDDNLFNEVIAGISLRVLHHKTSKLAHKDASVAM